MPAPSSAIAKAWFGRSSRKATLALIAAALIELKDRAPLLPSRWPRYRIARHACSRAICSDAFADSLGVGGQSVSFATLGTRHFSPPAQHLKPSEATY